MTAMVLAGGLGTRLRPVVEDRPKVLAPVAGRRFLAYLLDQLADAGVREAVLCTGYLGSQVEAAFGGYYRRMRLVYSQELQPLGTAGAIRNALSYIETDHVLILNGDSYCDCDIRELITAHSAHRLPVSIVLARVENASRFGAVKCDSNQRVVQFGEKSHAGPGWISAGLYIVPRQFIADLPEGVAVSTEKDCFPKWLDAGIFGFEGGSRFLDIGVPSSFAEAQSFFAPEGIARGITSKRRCIFLDRDGTVNVERHYLSSPDQLEILPGVAQGVSRLRQLGFGIVLITNQSAIGRGRFDVQQLTVINDRLRHMLGEYEIGLDAIYYCPHTPEDACGCRKPEPGLIEQAVRDLGISTEESVVIGDKRCDIELGKTLGATTILVRTGYGRQAEQSAVEPDFVVDDLMGAATFIENSFHAVSARR